MGAAKQIRTLYWVSGLSASEIGKRLQLTQWQVFKRMKKYRIPRRSQAKTHKIQFLRSPLSYSKKKLLTKEEKLLHLAGLMLYWAEGSKRNKYCVDFANSDERMLTLFLEMLRKIYGVKEKKLRILIYCYANQKPPQLVKYWSNLLKISKSQFTKPYVRQDFNVNNPRRMTNGLVHIRYNDMRLLLEIKRDIDIIYSSFKTS